MGVAHKIRPHQAREVHRHHQLAATRGEPRQDRHGRMRMRLVRAFVAGFALMLLVILVVSYLENGGHYL